jgi:hypothetical protein
MEHRFCEEEIRDPQQFLNNWVEIHPSMGGGGLRGICTATRDGLCVVDVDGWDHAIPPHKLALIVFREPRIRIRYRILHFVLKYGSAFVLGVCAGAIAIWTTANG